MEHHDFMQIDVDKLLESKNPRLAYHIPGFIKKYLRKIVHQDEINYILRTYSHLEGIDFIHAIFEYMHIDYEACGIEKIPEQGRYMFVSNHPFGGFDGLMIVDQLTSRFGSTRIIVNDLLMNIHPLKNLFIPINKHGRQSVDYLNEYKCAMNGQDQIATFPSGMCSRRIRGKISDLEWKPNFIKSAVNSHRDIVPIFVEGKLSDFFYNLSAFRQMLGIKANIEMLYLADELFRQKGSSFIVRYGDPIPYKRLLSFSSRQAVNVVRNKVYSLSSEKK